MLYLIQDHCGNLEKVDIGEHAGVSAGLIACGEELVQQLRQGAADPRCRRLKTRGRCLSGNVLCCAYIARLPSI